MEQAEILSEGRNCWRIGRADRASFLIDADSYFKSLVSAMDEAREAIYICGWDIDSRLRLIRDGQDRSDIQLGTYINEKAGSTPGLNIYILCWDFSFIYTLERELLGAVKLGWKTHERIHFHLDNDHPAGAAHHQKFAVVDDAVAFCGGIDLTKNRWDTPCHRSDEPLRENPDGKFYTPFHDIQMAVDAEPAASLGDLFRRRWLWATGTRLKPVHRKAPVSWPQAASPHMSNARIGIARTYPAYKGRPEIREVEALYLDAIRAAQRIIYMENQYFTAPVIADALVERLKQAEGPDVVMVLPEKSSGLLEQSTMDALRARQIQRVLEADRHNRLRIVTPILDDGHALFVHAKIMIVDDRLARIGSSNLTSRSMGLDTECDLVAEARGDAQSRRGILGFRNRLLSEHTGRTMEAVDDMCRSTASLIQAIDALTRPGRRLQPLGVEAELPVDGAKLLPDTSLLDPDRPGEIDQMFDQFVEKGDQHSKRGPLIKGLIILTVVLGLAAAWRWTPLSQWIDPQYLTDWGHSIKENDWSLFIVLGAYLIAGLLVIPVTVLVAVTAVVFPPLTAFFYSLSGCVLNAMLTYGIGAGLGKAPLQKFAGRKVDRLSKRLARRGILSVMVIRNVPVAPYTVVNMLAGASRIGFKDYVVGTCIGMAPGIGVLTFFVDRFIETLRDPAWTNILLTGGIAVGLAVLLWRIKRRLTKSEEEK